MRVEVDQNIINHRKTKALMRALKLRNQPTAIGHMVALWAWCMDNAPDGDLSGIDVRDIAEGALWSEDPRIFWQALLTAGFIDGDGRVHHWHHYNGAVIERKTADRKRKHIATPIPSENGTFQKNVPALSTVSGDGRHISLDTNTLTNDENHKGGDNGNNGYHQDELPDDELLNVPFSIGNFPHIYNRRIDNTVSNTDNILSIDNIYINKSGKFPSENGINSQANDTEFEAFFTVFWKIYPPRNGKKLEKARVKAWLAKNIKAKERQTLLRAVRNYIPIAGSYPKDPIRFLQGDFWREYIEPGDPDATKAQTRPKGRDPTPPLDKDKYTNGKYAHLFNREGDIDNDQ